MPPHVLIVEPYSDLRAAIEHALARSEFECVCASSEEDAIRKLQGRRFSAILLAPTLPIKDDAVMHFLHEHQPSEVPKVILMTDDDGDAEPGRDECRVLLKPFDGKELCREVSAGSSSASLRL